MKKLSIKLKITIWFTTTMILLSIVVFAFFMLISRNTSSSQVKNTLVNIVDENTREVSYDDGEIDIDDDFEMLKNGVNCVVFDSSGTKVSGYLEYDEFGLEKLEDGVLKTVIVNNERYFIYDKLVYDDDDPPIWVRGIVNENNNIFLSSVMYLSILICFPLLIILASILGYFIAWHSLKPIKEISKMAEEIEKSGDLSKRIELKNNKDELNNLAVTFNNMFKQLETNFESERNFTSDASHELRTPVAIILAQCEYAFENATNTDELYEAIGAIQKQGYRMSKLIESLLQFTRIEQNIENTTMQTINLSSTITSICEEYELIDIKGITLEKYIQNDILFNADLSLITRLCQNLIQNAYRYGNENGKVIVTLKEENNSILFSVNDNGIGISEDEISNIFKRFYRVDKSRSDGKGMGLGLAMVKQIAEMYDGTVKVQSELGHFSTFTVIFEKGLNES